MATERGGRLRAFAAVVTVLLLGGGIGAAAGWWWWTWWSPGFDGVVYVTTSGPQWLPDPFDPGLADSFTGTALYVVIGAGLGVVLGALAGLLMRRRPLPGLVVTVIASAIAAVTMLVVGTASSPPDPQSFATAAEVGSSHPAALTVSGWTPYLAWPVGVLLGYGVVMLLAGLGDSVREREAEATWLSVTPGVTPGRSEPSPLP